jgi:hypothetical protein
MRYDLEPLLSAIELIEDFNALDLLKLEFYNVGKPVPIPADTIREWKYVGLSNKNYVTHILLPNADITGQPKAAPVHDLVGQDSNNHKGNL